MSRSGLQHIALVKSMIWKVGAGLLALCAGACKTDSTSPSKVQETIASQNSGPAPALPPNHPALPQQGGVAAAPAATQASADVMWTEPTGWQKLPTTSAMRKATYQVPAAPGDGEPGEMAVFYFGPQQGGGVEANIERWIGQFSGVESSAIQRSQRSVNGLTQHVIEIPSGSYSPGMGQPGNRANYALLAAVVETPSGPYFFKATGPAATITAARAEYFKMLDGMKVGSP